MKNRDSQIRSIRLRLKLTQEELARELGVSQASVSHWEIRDVMPRRWVLGELKRICKLRGVRFPKDLKYV